MILKKAVKADQMSRGVIAHQNVGLRSALHGPPRRKHLTKDTGAIIQLIQAGATSGEQTNPLMRNAVITT